MLYALALLVALIYTILAFLAEMVTWWFRPDFYQPLTPDKWFAAESAVIASVCGAAALLYVSGAVHGTVQLWLARARLRHNIQNDHLQRVDLATTFMPVAGALLGFLVAHVLNWFSGTEFGIWRWALQGLYALIIVGACRHDMWDTVRYWHYRTP